MPAGDFKWIVIATVAGFILGYIGYRMTSGRR
jgi:hypothetical protein